MIGKKLFTFFTVLIVISGKIFAQPNPPTPQVPILLNEYSASNVTGPTDDYGQHSDWVELMNNHTESVNLGGYYLSNDRNNKFKWEFPGTFVLGVGQLKSIWLSGRNISSGDNYHANFTLEQCKDQWLILSDSKGVIRDSVFVQPTMADHTRGRIDGHFIGVPYWRLYKQHTHLQPNPLVNFYIDYAPTPKVVITDLGVQKGKINTGGFFDGTQLAFFKLNGKTYDTTSMKCFNIFYTLSNGASADYPQEAYPPVGSTMQFIDTIVPITISQTSVLRAIAVPNPTFGNCGSYLPSFCETNTYFITSEDVSHDENFGVVSLSFDWRDTTWFTAQGQHPLPANSTSIHVEYYDKKVQMVEGYGLVNRPPQEEWKTKQRGFYVDIDDKRGFGCNFEGPIFNVQMLGTSTRTVFPTLHLKAGDIESHSPIINSGDGDSYGTGMRDVIMQSLAAKNNLRVNPLHIKPVVVFMNGKYAGVYNWYEVFDKYYEAFYNGQFRDSVDMHYMDNGQENSVTYFDGGVSQTTAPSTWKKLYDSVYAGQMNSKNQYEMVMKRLDKASFIDYMILNSYAMNSDLWRTNVAFARGLNAAAIGGKWHYYLWNMPAIFSFTAVSNVAAPYNSRGVSPCVLHTGPVSNSTITALRYNGHGNILRQLMNTVDNGGNGAGKFQLEYKNRYYDLMNGPLKCDNILKHFDGIYNLYLKEMQYHELPDKPFGSQTKDRWDTLMLQLRNFINQRCYIVDENYFSKSASCFGAGGGPYPLTVDVYPVGAGRVKLNSTILDSYLWSGQYYQTTLSFKAIPTNTNYAFHHWEFKQHTPMDPLSMDSVGVRFAQPDDVRAIFTDKSADVTFDGEGANIPTGFTPNGDGLNDDFRPLGPAEFAANYEMTIWNRWGQEVFRTVDPMKGWDGTFKGQQAITGVYAYVISYKNPFGENKIVTGNVTLSR